jgi:hypothetical protein
MNNLSQRTLQPIAAAYIAGLIDGEGTVTLSRRHANERRQLVVSIVSTERNILDWVLMQIGVGKVTNKRTVSPRHAPSFTYSISNRQALALLRQVVPFLRSYKRIRASMAVDRYVSVTPRNGRYSRAQDAARTQFEADFLAVKAGSTPLAN